MNNGGARMDPLGQGPYPNNFGCVQLLDTTQGTACATALKGLDDCESVACDNDTSCVDGNACLTAVDLGGCSQYVSTRSTACAATDLDGGVYNMCNQGMGFDPDYRYILTLICGAVSDGGPTDASTGG
jgi:hypothetical protein